MDKVISFFVIGFLCVALAAGNAVPNEDLQDLTKQTTVTGASEKCSQVKGIDNAVACFAMSTLKKLEDISAQDNIQILPGVVLQSDTPKEKQSRKQRTMELPASAEQKISKIFDMMLDIMSNIFTGRTLKVKFSEGESNSVMRAFEEGRGKMKKLAGPLMMALGAKLIAIVPILLGGLALFTAKALIVSKIAIVLAAIVALPSLFSGGGNLFSKFGQGGGGWANNGGSFGSYNPGPGYAYGAPATNQNYPYARSIDDAQDLAYSAQK